MNNYIVAFLCVFCFSLGVLSGVFSLALFRTRGDIPNHVYRHWKGMLYELLEKDVINEEQCAHMVIFRGLYGRHITYTMKQKDFFGKVKNYQGEEVDRFTLLR